MAKYKVEISGIDTSKIPVLTFKEMNELFEKYKNGDVEARNDLVEGNLKLVLSILKRFQHRVENMDDLFQVGCIGLLKAIDHFDTSQGVRFSTYAVPMIIGEIRRYLRDNSSLRVSRSVRDNAYRALAVKERLTGEKQREPDVEEIAREMGMKKEDIVFALDAISDPISLYEPVFQDGSETVCVMDQVRDTNSSDENWLDGILMKQAVADLSAREKKILALRFYEGRTQTEVASEIGISQAQVSRLEKGVMDKIKKNL